MTTKRRRFLARVLVRSAAVVGLIAAGAPTVATGKKPKRIEGGFLHTVFFWLKDPKNAQQRKKFEKELRIFTDNTPGILSRHIGTPADTNRPVIDNTWTYSLVLSFRSEKEHDIYQEHPLHKTFIKNAGELWSKVLVYDSVV